MAEFDRILQSYPRSDKMPSVLLKKGYAQVFLDYREVPGISLRRGQSSVLDRQMHKGGVVRGVVLGPDGPAAGAAVASWAQRPDRAGLLISNTHADAEGRFTLDSLAAVKHFLGARHGGLFSYEMFSPWTALKEAPDDAPKPVMERSIEIRPVRQPPMGFELPAPGSRGASIDVPPASSRTEPRSWRSVKM